MLQKKICETYFAGILCLRSSIYGCLSIVCPRAFPISKKNKNIQLIYCLKKISTHSACFKTNFSERIVYAKCSFVNIYKN